MASASQPLLSYDFSYFSHRTQSLAYLLAVQAFLTDTSAMYEAWLLSRAYQLLPGIQQIEGSTIQINLIL